MHPTKGDKSWAHNSWEWTDELSDRNDTQVIRNWANFRNDRTTVPKNTCAVRWVSKATRTPLAPFVVWDLDPLVREDQPILPSEWGQHRFFYWLAVRQSDVTPPVLRQPKDETDADNTIRARYSINVSEQRIWIEQTPVPVTILLNSKMGFDFSKPVTVYIGKSREVITPQMTLIQYDTVQKATVEARGDPD